MKVWRHPLIALGYGFAAALFIFTVRQPANLPVSPLSIAATTPDAWFYQPLVVKNYPASSPTPTMEPTAQPTETPPPADGSYYLWSGGILEGYAYTPQTIHVNTCYTSDCLNRWNASLVGDMTGDSYGIQGSILVSTNNSYRIYFRFLLAQAGLETTLVTYSADLQPGTWEFNFQPKKGPDPQAHSGDALIFEIDRRENNGWTSLEVTFGGDEGAWITAPSASLSPPAAFTRHSAAYNASDPYALDAADVDEDGDFDIAYLSQSGDYLAWAENDGKQNFSTHTIASGLDLPLNNASVQVTDIDLDGDFDLVSPVDWTDSFAWWENDGNEGFTRHDLTSPTSYPVVIMAADLDGDTDLDFAVAGSGLAWWENDGAQHFSRHAMTTVGNYSWIDPVDLDQDSDTDLLAASRSGSLAWWENDGSENFTRRAIRDGSSTSMGDRSTLRAADLDRDGDLDLISASDLLDELALWENDGTQNFTSSVLVSGFDHPNDLIAASLDGDTNLDLLAGGFAFAWYETSSNGFLRHLFLREAAAAIDIADLDGDGDIDILSASRSTDQVYWWENPQVP